jgi:hypothetical protein
VLEKQELQEFKVLQGQWELQVLEKQELQEFKVLQDLREIQDHREIQELQAL